MPTYDYKCPDCKIVFEIIHSIKDNSDVFCPDCGKKGKEIKMDRLISRNVNGFIFKQWTETQHYRYKRERQKDNKKLNKKQIERYGTGPKVKPNVAGVEVDSWSDAKKLAKEAGLNTSSYDSHIKNEKGISKISGINDNKWKSAKGD
jgi:putative FmdB family regulatory protein